MASIHLLGGKKQLVTIQVSEFVALHHVFQWAKLLRRHAKSSFSWAAALTSLALLIYLFTQFHGRMNGQSIPSLEGDDYEGAAIWTPSSSCKDCFLPKPIELGLLEPYLLLVLIHAKADDRARRDAIRQTWVSDFRGLLVPPVQYRFVVGGNGLSLNLVRNLLAEAERFEDMIILDEVVDSHLFLSKRTIEGFLYAINHFQFKYLMKCDDDTFVDLPRIASELQRRQYHDRFYWGFMTGANSVHFFGRYAEREWSLCDMYLPYAFGGGYIISRDLAKLLAANRRYLKQYSCEDVSVGAWLAPYNIERKHDTRFNTEAESRGCKNIFLVSHKVAPSEMYQMYESLQLEGMFCSWRNQWYSYSGFIYNWTAPTSQCCHRRFGVP